jgi:hypothetical protein
LRSYASAKRFFGRESSIKRKIKMNRQHVNVRKMRTQGWTRGAYGQGIVYDGKRGRSNVALYNLRVAHCVVHYDHAIGTVKLIKAK